VSSPGAGTARFGQPATVAAAVSLLCGLLAVGPAFADETPEHPGCPAVETRVEVDATSSVTTVPVPASVISYALPRQADGRRRIVLLVAPPEDREDTGALRTRLKQALRSGTLEEGAEGTEPIEIDASDPEALADLVELLGPVLGGEKKVAAACPWPEGPGSPALFLLDPHRLAPDGQDAGATPELTLIRRDLMAEDRAVIALDLNGDGDDEILLERGASLLLLPDEGDAPASGEPCLLFQDPDLRLRAEEPYDVHFPPEPVAVRSPLDEADVINPPGNRTGPRRAPLREAPAPLHLRVTALGVLRFYGPAGETGAWNLRAEVPLPVRSSPDPALLLLTSPQVRTVGRTAAGYALIAAGPVPYGEQRLRTVLIEVSDLDAPRVEEYWSQLPGRESIDRSGYFLLDGQPHLWVETRTEGEVQFFGSDERLRIFNLVPDRTRAGGAPVLAFGELKEFQETRLRLGQDVDGDDRQDLVFVGRDDDEVILTAYRQRPDGSFQRTPRRQQIEEGGRPLAYGRDLDGDGLPDLLIARRGQLRIHSGVAPSIDGKEMRLVGTAPAWAADRLRPTEDSPERVRCADLAASLAELDGDARSEWVCAGEDKHGRPHLKIIRFTNPR
jgi:hypothetical protein